MLDEQRPRSGTIQAQVLDRLRDGLMEGALLPGQPISIRKFAAALGTSPMPVRDAVAQLVAANALQEMPNRTVCVPILSRARIAELFEVRALLETRAARAACARATPEFVAGLAALNRPVDSESLRSAVTKLDVLRRNRTFHFTLYRWAASEILMPLIESLWMQCGPTLYLTLETGNAAMAQAQHRRIVEGLERGDADAVAAALEHEIRATGETLLASYETLMAQGPLAFVTPP
jgi:DNA-binding GntR family transcriptional regulator